MTTERKICEGGHGWITDDQRCKPLEEARIKLSNYVHQIIAPLASVVGTLDNMADGTCLAHRGTLTQLQKKIEAVIEMVRSLEPWDKTAKGESMQKSIKKKPAKKTEYQIGEVGMEIIRKTVMRHPSYKGKKNVEDVVKRIGTKFHVEYTQQGNFTICVLISDNEVVPGVAKRCPTDAENGVVGNTIALTNAVKNWLAL